MKKILSVVLIMVVMVTLIQTKTYAEKKQLDVEEYLNCFERSVNNSAIDEYISLFAPACQKEMQDFVLKNGETEFFAEESRTLISFEEASYEVDESQDERYEDVKAFIVKEEVILRDDISRRICLTESGIQENEVVFVLQDGNWYIYRISAISSATTSLEEPIEIFVYFTKQANLDFYGTDNEGIYFEDYLKDVLPNEWYISRYNGYNHNYGYATALASKMYAWYYGEHPKWNFSPYFANVKDNSSDQNYLINSMSSLSSRYQGYERTVLDYISNLAIVSSNTNTIFPTYYRASSGTQYSGRLNGSYTYTMVQNGYSYEDIIHYYYDYSSEIGSSNTAEIVSY